MAAALWVVGMTDGERRRSRRPAVDGYRKSNRLDLWGRGGHDTGMAGPMISGIPFPPPLDSYQDGGQGDLWSVLAGRAQAEPFNVVASVIFALAIVHTFLAPKILHWSHAVQHRFEAELERVHGPDFREKIARRQRQSIPAAILHFFGEVEAVFGLWVVPLAILLCLVKGPAVMRGYLDVGVSYTEPLFVVVIMAMAASRPVVDFAVWLLGLVAGKSPVRWWFALLTLGPLLGSFITEPAAMTICAVLLGREFFGRGPGLVFRYATLGLLFVNISVGGALTHFAAPPVLMVAAKWNWDTAYMMENFGGRAVAGIVASNVIYFLIFRKEFGRLAEKAEDDPAERGERVPFWITAVHLLFLGLTVMFAHEPALFIGGFLFFLAFTMATTAYQDEIRMRSPMLVGFFLAGLVVHGGLQGWWIEPVLSRLGEYPLLVGATVLTAFNDNAAITYLATLVPNFSDTLKNAVVSGAICGGGLTVIANAPNPAGQSILQKFFPNGSIAPGGLLLAALAPTLVMLLFFALPR
ncbi:MAG: putative Na+/H+ antiporter [Methylacidiphilales bacterium]|nr:putative Na+/H+ antiporter [Candidatus Methylacidiphilales bacterium]